MKIIVVDEITGEREVTNIQFNGNFSEGITQKEGISVCMLNNEPADINNLIVKNEDELLFVVRPTGPAIAAFAIKFAISFAISAMLNFAISKIFKKKTQKPTTREANRQREESPTYGFEGMRDTLSPGSPIPFVLGKARKGGQIISTRVEHFDSGKKQRLYMLLAMAHGEVESIESVEVNGTAIGNYSGASFDWRPGTSNQTVMTDFDFISQVYFDGRNFSVGAITYTTHGDVDKVDLYVSTIAGMYHQNKDTGDFETNYTEYEVSYRVASPPGSWTIVKGNSWFSNNFVLQAASTNIRFSIPKIIFPAKETYDIKLRHVSQQHGVESEDSWHLGLHNVVEIQNGTNAYPNIALLGIRAVATNNLNGSLPTITAIVKGKVTVGSGLAYSENPSHCIKYILTNSIWGLGHRIPLWMVDEDSWVAFGAKCDEIVDGFPDPNNPSTFFQITRHTISYVGDIKRKGWDIIKTLLASYDASIVFSEGRLKVVIDEAKFPAMLYSEAANMVASSLTVTWGRSERRFNTVQARYYPEEDGYRPDFVTVEDENALLTEDIKLETIDLIGISRQEEAIRSAKRHLKENVLRYKEYSWKSPMMALVSEPGDVVKLQYFVSDYSRGKSGFILDGGFTELILDSEVTLLYGKTYEVYVQHKLTNTFEKVDVLNGEGIWGRLRLASSLTEIPIEGDHFIMGEKNVAISDVVITEITGTSDGTFSIRGDNYDPAAYSLDELPAKITRNRIQIGDVPPIPIESWTVRESTNLMPDGTRQTSLVFDIQPGFLDNPGIAVLGTATTIKLSASEPTRDRFFDGADITITSGTGAGQIQRNIINYDGNAQRVVGLNWTTPPDSTSEYNIKFSKAGEYYSSLVEYSFDQLNWFEMGTVVGGEGSIAAHASFQGLTVYIRLIPFTNTGKSNKLALLIQQFTLSGVDADPADISNFSAVQVSDRLLFTWTKIASVDLAYYEIREGNSWEASVLVQAGIKREFYEDTSYTPGTKNYLIKARDLSGNYSTNAVSFSITITDSILRENYTTYAEHTNWNGTLSGLSTISIDSVTTGLRLAPADVWDTAGDYWDTSGDVWDGTSVLTGSYTSEKINLGTIALARIISDIGFENSTNSTLKVEERHSDDDITYTNWRLIGAGDQQWRYAQLKFTLTKVADDDNPIINKFNVVVDAPIKRIRGVSTGTTGQVITFSIDYINTPVITLTPQASAKVWATAITKSGFTINHDAGGSISVNWTSEGI